MSLRRLLGMHLRPYAPVLMVVVALQTVQTTATLMLPNLSSTLVDNGVLTGNQGYILRVGAVMLGFSLVQIVFAAGAVRYGSMAAMGFGRDVRRNLFHTVTGYSAREVSTFGAPSLITRITNDVQQVQVLVVMVATMMITAPLTMVIGLIMAVREDLGLSRVVAAAIPTVVVVLGIFIVQMVPAFRLMQERIDRVNAVLREQLAGLRVVRAFVRESEEEARFAEANQELTAVSLRAGRLMAMMFPTVMLLVNASSIAVLWVGGGEIAAGNLQIGSLIAYLTYLVQILMAVVMLTLMVSMIPRAGVAADRIVEVLDTEPSVVEPAAPVTAPVAHLPDPGTLELRRVTFCYPGAEHPVLSDVSCRVERGRTLAVIGSTGSGKTTLVNLMVRLMDPTAGSVRLHGVDLRHLDPGLLWGHIGYVPQRAYLFAGTVASNLRFGRPEATDADLWDALEVAQAADFVRAMPEGLHSPITQGGTNVSGGQRQRLAIARALVVRPELFVFDDAFSALDLATDARLRAALRPHTTDAAVVVVAQRVSTICEADEILVLEDGVVVGRGTHDELVHVCPTYAEIVESQQGQGAVA